MRDRIDIMGSRGPRVSGTTWFVIVMGIIAFALIMSGEAKSQEKTPEKTDEQIFAEYIEWFHSNVNPKKGEKAKEIIPVVMKWSAVYEVDWMLVACIISLESSWRPRPGSLGESGYMQVMRNKWSRRFDLDTPEGQIEAGTARLAMAFYECGGDLKKALTHYASGSCKARTETTRSKIRYRVHYYRKISKKFRGE